FKEIQKLIKYKCKNSSRWYYLKNLGHQYFFSTVKLCDVFIGNSSSGISEIPSLHVPTVNIGSRQNGRPRSFSIIDTNFEVKNIQKAIKKSMSKNFQKKIKKSKNLFYRNDSLKIINQNILKFLNSKNKQKLFFNINF
ncbi:MAG: UDP-N-acetylglucosamine 2-epimerase (hydrolyzing), partial [Candidatus Marinimicrobia bacterium]|nr:UDP-N-acetylglucosamine 2-epimerase (hydrolyzing) [Candidatus Neomarinimicrobiota bacterium]